MQQLAQHTETRRAAARRAFWSDHPLNLAFRDERHQNIFSLKEFIAFVIAMPSAQFLSLTGGHDAR